MKSIKVCEYSRSRSFHYDLILQDQASGERSQDQWSSGFKIGLAVKSVKVITGSSFAQTMMGWRPRCYIPSFVEIGPLVLEKKIFEWFLPYMGLVAIMVI